MSKPEALPPIEGQQRFVVRQSVSTEDRTAQLDLRYRVLREPLGMSREQAVFARDDDPDTVHLLAVAQVLPIRLAGWMRAPSVRVTKSARPRSMQVLPIRLAGWMRAPSVRVTKSARPRSMQVRDKHDAVQSAEIEELIVVGTATMITHGPNEVQLRGMASDQAWAGSGVGRAVLEAAHVLAGSRSLWCDARMSAHDFYARFGWVAEGEQFDIPQVGPHTVMRYQPDSSRPTDTVEK